MENIVMDTHFRRLRDRDADRVRITKSASVAASEKVETHVQNFLESGGNIQQTPRGVSGQDLRMKNGKYIANPYSGISLQGSNQTRR